VCNTRSTIITDEGILVKILDDTLILRIFFVDAKRVIMLFRLTIIASRVVVLVVGSFISSSGVNTNMKK
jgi:hypothetical protein